MNSYKQHCDENYSAVFYVDISGDSEFLKAEKATFQEFPKIGKKADKCVDCKKCRCYIHYNERAVAL